MPKRNFLLIILTIFLILIASQCFTNAQRYKIGAIWGNDSIMGDEIFASAISKLDKSKFDYKVVKFNAKGDSKKLTETIKKWDSDEVDCIYAVGNKSAKLAHSVVKNVPTIAFAVKNPKGLGIIKNLRAPKGKITAVSYYVNPRKQMRILIIANPNVKKIGLIHEKIFAKSVEVLESKSAIRELGIGVTAYPIKTYKDCAKSVRILRNTLKVDAIIMCANTQVVKATEDIVATAGEIPVLSYDSDAIDRGALFGLVASSEKMGETVADYTIKILRDNMPIEKLPVVFPKEPILKINVDTLKNVNVNIPESLLEKAEKVKTIED